MCKDDLAFSLIALTIIGYIYTVTQFVVIIPWLGLSTGLGMTHLAVINVLCGLILLSYFSASFTDPGMVPHGYDPEGDKGFGATPTRGGASGKPANFCRKCNHIKPPRTHHCSVCGRCVLKMDHHCPWINNCVGHRNHKHFMCFLLWVVVSLTYVLVVSVWRLTSFFPIEDAYEYMSPGSAVLLAISLFLTVLVLLGVGFLFGFQISLVIRNMTTIESWEFDDASRRARRRGKRVHHLYDLGVSANLSSFFGPSLLTWPFPCGAIGDGLHYETYDFTRAPDVLSSAEDWSLKRGAGRV